MKRHPLQPKTWSGGQQYERFECVRPYLQGRSVLDLGCVVGHHRQDWMHGLVRQVARHAKGVDIQAETVHELRGAGYDMMVGDACNVRLNETFDVVFAGELIEHLDDHRGFLRTVRAHLEEDGLFVLTTPNAFAFTNFLYRLGSSARINDEHTCWFCEDTIRQLLNRHGFALLEVRYIPHRTPGKIRRALAGAARALLPDRLRWGTILVVATPAASAERL